MANCLVSLADAFVTLDRGILYQHNHVGQELIIVVLRVADSTIESLSRHAESLLVFLKPAEAGARIEIGQ